MKYIGGNFVLSSFLVKLLMAINGSGGVLDVINFYKHRIVFTNLYGNVIDVSGIWIE